MAEGIFELGLLVPRMERQDCVGPTARPQVKSPQLCQLV